jgi:transcriptional regulator with XRE-family HTH domain
MVCATRQEERTQQVAEETKGIALPGLATVRKRAGLSQKELAARAGVTRQTISRIEQGGYAYYDTLDKLAKALRVSRKRLLEDITPQQQS